MKRNTPRHAIEESIDETIAQLNETIEEIRSLDVRTETLTEIIPADIPPPPKMKKPLVGLHHSKSASRLHENRFIVGEIRPEETRTYLQSKATHHSSRRMTFLRHVEIGFYSYPFLPDDDGFFRIVFPIRIHPPE